MTTICILATGPSLTPEAVARVRHLPCVAVSDAYRLAPWACALVSADKAWWRVHIPDFAGTRYTLADVPEVEKVTDLAMGSNSGLLACHIAVTRLGAKRLLLLGLDMQGSHFFGRHPEPLKNTKPERFEQMKKQFANWAPKRVEVWNCNENSGLTCFPRMTLDAALNRLAELEVHAGRSCGYVPAGAGEVRV